jgi:hypothetical protein
MRMRDGTRARDKAFRAAARALADQWGYTGIDRDEVIATTIQDRTGDWQVIWDRALKYSDKWWTAFNDDAAAEIHRHVTAAETTAESLAIQAKAAATKLSETVAYKDKLLMERTSDVARLAARNREQEATIRSLMASTQKLRDELDRLKTDLVENAPHLRIRALEMELSKVRAELEETKKHTTSATWKVFEENARLVAELRLVENDLGLAQDEVTDERLRRQKAEELHLAEKQKNEVPLVACQTVTGRHLCELKIQQGRRHPQAHRCHCGMLWS